MPKTNDSRWSQRNAHLLRTRAKNRFAPEQSAHKNLTTTIPSQLKSIFKRVTALTIKTSRQRPRREFIQLQKRRQLTRRIQGVLCATIWVVSTTSYEYRRTVQYAENGQQCWVTVLIEIYWNSAQLIEKASQCYATTKRLREWGYCRE